MLEEERYRVERLEVQINDMTELEQHEIHNLRQVIKNLYLYRNLFYFIS